MMQKVLQNSDLLGSILRYLHPIDFREFWLSSREYYKRLDDDRYWQKAQLQTERVCREIFVHGRNVFMTGPGGTGKTHTLKRILYYARRRSWETAATATTGMAATAFVEGRTIHSFSGLTTTTGTGEYGRKFIPGEYNFRRTRLLLIDEISMLGKSLLERIDRAAKRARRNQTRPFGGLQVVFCGDFLQLEPIDDEYCFKAPVWQDFKFFRADMTVPVRHISDRGYYELLCRIRTCTHTAADIAILKTRTVTEKDLEEAYLKTGVKPTRIYCVNREVDALNTTAFNALKTPIEMTSVATDRLEKRFKFDGKWMWETVLDPKLLDECRKKVVTNMVRRCPEKLQFRIGAQYILTYNLSVKDGLCNGSRCTYVGAPNLFKFVNGLIMELKCIEQRFQAGSTFCVVRTQIPLRLGYAISTHGSQGSTLDSAVIDLGRDVFANSQAYVALSRVRSLSALHLLHFDETKIRASPEALSFYHLPAISSSSSSSRKRPRSDS